MNRKLLLLLALLAVGGFIAYWVFGGDFDWELFFASLSSLSMVWVAVSIVLSMLTYLLRAMRWRALLAPLKYIPLARLFWATISGFSAIYVIGRAAELARPIWLTRREQVPFSAAIATIFVERFLDSLMLIAVFAWALMVIEVPPESAAILSSLKSAGWFIAATATAAMMLLFVLRSRAESIARLIRRIHLPKVATVTEDFVRGLTFLGSARSLAIVTLQSAVLWIVIALQSWSMFFAMDLSFSFGAATLVMVAGAIGSIAQIPGIGGGFQVAWIFCMMTFFRIPAEQAAATAITAFVLSYVPTIIVGSLYMTAQGVSMNEFRTSIRNTGSETLV